LFNTRVISTTKDTIRNTDITLIRRAIQRRRRHLRKKRCQRKPNLRKLTKINKEKMRSNKLKKMLVKYKSRNRLRMRLINLQNNTQLKRNLKRR